MKPTDEATIANALIDASINEKISVLEAKAFLALLPGEPVAWQWRKKDRLMKHEEVWSFVDYHTGLKINEFPDKYETRPLYTSPTPHLSVDREALLEEATQALKPFSASGWVDDNGWTELACQNDRIVDWFGPSDFRAVVLILSKLEGSSDAKA